MSWSNYHQHCYFCDGTDAPEKYVKTALANGIKSFGFSSHAPVPMDVKWCIKQERFNDYLAEIKAIQQQYKDELPIFIGCEIDFLPNKMGPNSPQFEVLDYNVGSVHFVNQFEDGTYWGIDDTFKMYQRGINELFGGNAQAAVEAYFAITRMMIEEDAPDILGHMDKIKMNNKNQQFFEETETWYQKAVLATLESVAASDKNIIIEVNTRGVYKKKTLHPYPSPWVLKHIHAMDIPIMINSDCHHPREVTDCFAATAEMLQSIGFKTLQILTKDGFEARPFDKNGIKF